MSGRFPVQSRSLSCGFTLVELVLVLVVVGVLASVAAPRLLEQGATRTRGATIEVRAALRHAQKLAMSKNREVCATLAATQVALTFNPLATPGAPCVSNVSRPGSDEAYLYNLPAGVALTPPANVRFDVRGRPNGAFNWTVGGSQVVSLEAETGYVR